MICHADSDDDDDLIMSRVVIEIVMNPMCWKSGDGNCDGWKVCSLCLSTSHTRPLPCSRDGNLLSCLTNQYSCLFDLWSQWKRGRWWSWWRRSPVSPQSQQSTNLLHLPPPPLMRFSIITVITIFNTNIIVIHLINWDLWPGEHGLPGRAGGGEGEAGGVAAGREHQLHLQPPSQAPRKWSVSGEKAALIMPYPLSRDKSHTKRRGAQLVT